MGNMSTFVKRWVKSTQEEMRIINRTLFGELLGGNEAIMAGKSFKLEKRYWKFDMKEMETHEGVKESPLRGSCVSGNGFQRIS